MTRAAPAVSHLTMGYASANTQPLVATYGLEILVYIVLLVSRRKASQLIKNAMYYIYACFAYLHEIILPTLCSIRNGGA